MMRGSAGQILTRDSVTVSVDAVVYYRIQNPMMSVINIEDVCKSTRLLSQTTLRNYLGMCTLTEILTDRDQISNRMLVRACTTGTWLFDKSSTVNSVFVAMPLLKCCTPPFDITPTFLLRRLLPAQSINVNILSNILSMKY